jgi:penicillin-binding protein 2
MFQRRLLLLAALGVVGMATPLLQMARLSVVKADDLRAQAEKRLVSEQWLETTRGRILDRKGRVLAMDRPCFDVSVDYPVITGQWAYAQGAKRARRQHRSEWAQLSPDQRDALIREAQAAFDAQLEAMWARFTSLAGVSRADLDERRLDIRRQVQDLALTVTERKRQTRERQLEERLGKGEEQSVDVATADVRRPIREQNTAHVLLKGVPESVGFEFARLIAEDRNRLKQDPAAVPLMPGVHVMDSGRREYPFDAAELEVDLSSFPGPLRQDRKVTVRADGIAAHVIGWMRSKLYDEDMMRRPRLKPDGSLDRGHYRPGDAVGQGGIEQGAEDDLRGLRGVLTQHLDTDQIERLEPQSGDDVKLALDAALQARIQALFEPSLGLTIVQPWHHSKTAPPPPSGVPGELPLATPLDGSVVVIDIASGDVLAMVSMPSFSHHQLETEPESVFGDKDRVPFLNRAIDKAYPPGSIVKPLMLTSAITAHKLGIDERIHCTGAFFPSKPNLYRCWIYKQSHNSRTHDSQFEGGLDGSDAIQVSCNIFFFEMGQRLGPAGVTAWYTRFGVGPDADRWELFGQPSQLLRMPDESASDFESRVKAILGQRSLLHEFAGSLERDPEKPGQPRPPLTISEAILMGIGQGPIAWTPMHAADAYATIARGGVKLTPRLRLDAPQKRTELGITSAAIRKALEGLRRSANEELGTTHHVNFDMPDGSTKRERTFNAPGVSIWAKSGTADAPQFEMHTDEEGQPMKFDADHAWCVFLAGVGDQPRYAVSVVIEHGGSGGRVAGPVANQVVHALIAEGYLPHVDKPGEERAAAAESNLTAAAGNGGTGGTGGANHP